MSASSLSKFSRNSSLSSSFSRILPSNTTLQKSHFHATSHSFAKKKLKAKLQFYLPVGKASTGPPVGTCLGHYGIPAGKFTKDFNAKSKEAGYEDETTVQCHLRVYTDFTFDFKVHEPDTSYYLLQGRKGPDMAGYYHKFKGVDPDFILTPEMIYEVAKLKYSHYEARKGKPMPFDVFLKTMIHGVQSCGFHVSYLDYDPHKDPYISGAQKRALIDKFDGSKKRAVVQHIDNAEQPKKKTSSKKK